MSAELERAQDLARQLAADVQAWSRNSQQHQAEKKRYELALGVIAGFSDDEAAMMDGTVRAFVKIARDALYGDLLADLETGRKRRPLESADA